jgi:ribonuclease P protein component
VSGPAELGGGRLPRLRRITRSMEIRTLFRRGKRRRTAHLDVLESASPAALARVGIVVPRYKRSAVARNRVKRRLREVLRREVLTRLDGAGLALDVMVRARPEAYAASFAQLSEELVTWAERRCSRAR